MKEQPVGVAAHSVYWHTLVIVLVCFVTYSNSFSGDFIWDDRDQIVHNESIRSFRHIPTAFTSPFWAFAGQQSTNFYRPFQTLFYMIAYQMGGTTPWPYHLINVSFHALASVFVYLICWELRLGSFLQLFAAALFAVHPVHTEAVTWIAGLPDTGCGAFYLFSVWAYLRHVRTSTRIWLYASACSFLFSLFFKEMAITLPAVILGLTALQRRFSRGNFRRILAGLSPYLAVAVIYAGMRWIALGHLVMSHSLPSASLTDWLTMALIIFGQYIRYALLPYPLAGYHMTVLKFHDRPELTIGYFGLIVVVCLAVWFARKRIPELRIWFILVCHHLSPGF